MAFSFETSINCLHSACTIFLMLAKSANIAVLSKIIINVDYNIVAHVVAFTQQNSNFISNQYQV